jgi:hypothetical protein
MRVFVRISCFLTVMFGISNFLNAIAMESETSFTPLKEAEYPKSKLQFKSTRTNTIKAHLVRQLPQAIKQNFGPQPIALLADIIEVTGTDHDLEFQFMPYAFSSFIVPTGFPLDAHTLVQSYCMKRKWTPEKGIPFGGMNADIVLDEHVVGHWESALAETPVSFLQKLSSTILSLQNETLKQVCLRNRNLMVAAEALLNPTQKTADISISDVYKLSKLLAYTLGGEVKENPTPGIGLEIIFPRAQKLIIPTRLNESLDQLKLRVKSGFGDIVKALGFQFDSKTKIFTRGL